MAFNGVEARKAAIVRVNDSLIDLPNAGFKQRTKRETIWSIKVMMRRPGISERNPIFTGLCHAERSFVCRTMAFPANSVTGGVGPHNGKP